MARCDMGDIIGVNREHTPYIICDSSSSPLTPNLCGPHALKYCILSVMVLQAVQLI